ncbi:MAG: pyruvate oxidoreductase subunit gamma [Candidatus Hydrogenedentes bacterium]|jgi:pyruvate ferredoxin oxidoreductase gamma subunit|nr:pyruvate oxidoreductase subunit gamma [Candidatus Hydrogenedentota bacterium]
MQKKLTKEFDVRWHGRGGQGAVTSANMLAEAAYHAGFRGIMSAPTFGAERRGAPITASTRIAPRPLRSLSQVDKPDMIVVLDDSLLTAANATKGLAKNGLVIINTNRELDELPGLNNGYRVAMVNANHVAEEVGLIISGALMINTAMLGAISRAFEVIKLEHVEKALNSIFSPAAAKKNFEAARLSYEQTRCFSPEEILV